MGKDGSKQAGKLLSFPGAAQEADFARIEAQGLTRADAKKLGAVGLQALRSYLEARYAAVEAEEPEDEESDEYEAWMERLDELDDLLDETGDALDELNGES